jgi:hypothetical protein
MSTHVFPLAGSVDPLCAICRLPRSQIEKERMTPSQAAQQLREMALASTSGADTEAIVIILDHVGALERAISLAKASHENFVRHLPENAVHETRVHKSIERGVVAVPGSKPNPGPRKRFSIEKELPVYGGPSLKTRSTKR